LDPGKDVNLGPEDMRRCIANLAAAYVEPPPRRQRRLEAVIAMLSPAATDYIELAKAFIEERVPLQSLLYISTLLPGAPKIALVPGKVEGGFYVKGEEGVNTVNTIVGLDENGRILVRAMIEAVKAAAESHPTQKAPSTQRVQRARKAAPSRRPKSPQHSSSEDKKI
jgi:hypothetical protein